MGFMDELKKLARPYAEDEDDFDEFEEDVAPAHSNTRAAEQDTAPASRRTTAAGVAGVILYGIL